MKDNIFEAIIGFIVLIFCAFAIYFLNNQNYSQKNNSNSIYFLAEFNNTDGIFVGSDVKIAGIKVGSIKSIELNKENYKINLAIQLTEQLQIPTDSSLAVRTGNLTGGKYIEIIIGSDEEYLTSGDYISFTQSSIIFEDILNKFLLQYNKK